MQISNHYAQSNAAEWAKKAAAEGSSRTKKGNEQKSKTASAQVSISANAGKGNSVEALVKARANALPEIREEKVALAKERMESGYYNTESFSNELANRLAGD